MLERSFLFAEDQVIRNISLDLVPLITGELSNSIDLGNNQDVTNSDI
ncbi:MAG: hypothetical protein P8171_09670 [Candidatus Thiodiazotropha sp.]